MPWFFAYGTVMRGMLNHHVISDHILLCLRATTTGKIYHLPEGYPMLVPDKGNIVYGEVLKIYDDSPALGILDELEGFLGPNHPDNLFERVERDIHLPDVAWKVRAIIYICPEHKKKQVMQKATLVNGGDWKEFIESNKK